MVEVVDILIEHGTLLTMDQQRRILTDGAIAIRGDRIVAVGKTAELRKQYRRHQDHRRIERVWSCPAWSMAMRT